MFTTFGFLDLGAPQLLIILAIVVLLFGSKKLPELSRSVGESMQELKKAASGAGDIRNEVSSQVNGVKAEISEVKASIIGNDRRI